MPAKAKAKKKVQRRKEIQELVSPQAQKKMERRVQARLAELDEIFDERYAIALEILEMQTDDVKAVAYRMQATMKRMAGVPRGFKFEGQMVNVDPEILERLQEKNHLWVAVRLLVTLAVWGTDVCGMKLPKDKCAYCLTPVKKARKKKR